MANTDFDASKPTVTIVHESPSLLRAWWMNGNLRYDVAMSSIIIIINIAAIVHMRTHKIPLIATNLFVGSFELFTTLYFITGIASCLSWIMAIQRVELSECYMIGRICHAMGFGIFFDLLYCISPYSALHFGLPFSLWFVAALIGPCCPCIWRGLCKQVQKIRDWWKFVNQPQLAVVV